jgi:tRNA(Ile)-lysidine synthase
VTAAALNFAIARVPAGRWAVGVSGGADSVALLRLLHQRSDITLHVVHLDHQTRGADSAADADFVRDLAGQLDLPVTVALRGDIEKTIENLPANPSSRYRSLRLALFKRTVTEHALSGVVLAHHADDQAETVLHRLLRGSGPMGLAAMQALIEIDGLRILRPLLNRRREELRKFLRAVDQAWREDASNRSDRYFRNRLRAALAVHPETAAESVVLGDACRELRAWARRAAPTLAAEFQSRQLADLPSPLAGESARRWLIDRNVPPDQIAPPVVARLISMAGDAGIKAGNFPGGILVRRTRGIIRACPHNE